MTTLAGNLRIGLGTDRHRLILGTGLLIGGVKIPCDYAADAHSDGDVLLHALTDAILGALAAGDIGDLFPDNHADNFTRDSSEFVKGALCLMREAGYALVNLDAVVQLQTPKLVTYKTSMRSTIAAICECLENEVSVKAKTGERVGLIGRSEVIEAQVVVLLAGIKEQHE